MQVEEGKIVTGKVTGITKFGAFVELENGETGLVHISEISLDYVNDINDHIKVGEKVEVKVLPSEKKGKIGLSIKQAMKEKLGIEDAPKRVSRQRQQKREPYVPDFSVQPVEFSFGNQNDSQMSFEDKLKQFMQDSDSKISGIKQYSERRVNTRRGKR